VPEIELTQYDVIYVHRKVGRRRRQPRVLHTCYGAAMMGQYAHRAVLVDPPGSDYDRDWIASSLMTRLTGPGCDDFAAAYPELTPGRKDAT
jgi:hypothetical protein